MRCVASPSGPLLVCSYDAPCVKTDPAPGVTIWNVTKKENFQNFSKLFFSETENESVG